MRHQHDPEIDAPTGSTSPTAPGLTPSQLGRLRRALEAKKAQLLRACEARDEGAAEAEAESSDIADVAEGVIEDRERAALDEHDRAILEDVERALARLDAGTYGTSEQSGRPIPFERLWAVPWARYDADEAERIER